MSTAQNSTAEPEVLNGWKDIAGYLGRSSRTVQRWERELGLPVHRIKGTDGQSVYTTRLELDEWRRSRDLPRPLPEDEDGACSDPNPVSTEGAIAASPEPATAPSWTLLWMVAALTLLLGMVAGYFIRPPMRGPITGTLIAGTKISAFDRLGRTVWSKDMGALVSLAGASGVQSYEPTRFGPNGDLIFGVHFAPSGNISTSEGDALISIDSAGNQRWKISPTIELACGTETFSGPWRLLSVTISTDAAHPRLWAAFNHNTWWPGVLLEIDENGHSTVRYVQTGWIRSTTEFTSPSGRFLAVAGVLNEFERASTVLLDLNGPAATTPHRDPRFNCANAPESQPASIVLWPELDVKGPASYVMAVQVQRTASGLSVLLDAGGGDAVGELDSAGQVKSLSLADNYWTLHRALEAQGILHHPAELCPERVKHQPIETWTSANGWAHSTILPTIRQTPKR